MTRLLNLRSIFLIGISILSWSLSGYAQMVDGNFVVVQGQVQLKSSTNGKITKAKIGERIRPEDTIITGKESRAKVVMVDGNVINVLPKSSFEIKTYVYKPQKNKKNVLLHLMYGKIRAMVQQKYYGANKFRITTPSAAVGVHGTDFITSYNTSTHVTSIMTFRGRVEFGHLNSAGHFVNPVFVNAGEMSRLLAFRRPMPPTRMSKVFMAKMKRESEAATGAAP